MIQIGGHELRSDRSCRHFDLNIEDTYTTITVTLSIISMLALVICIFTLIKIRKNKRQLLNETISEVATSINSSQANAMTENRTPYNRDLSNLPPIGSAEAEFQNDFIQVFPMHHLEPCPEKNTTPFLIQ